MRPSGPWIALWISLGLLILAIIPYAEVASHGFLKLDDDLYVTDNPHVREGLTREGIVWAFTEAYADNRHPLKHPLTWISHMADCQLFGLAPRGPHLVNVGLHALTAVLLFLAFCFMTGEAAPSALVAALFAVHPLRVEAVAWIAERKEVLAGCFFALTVLAYAWYARRPGFARYGLVVASFVAGVLAKPTLVTLPLVLLLLDLWPLGRFRLGETLPRRVVLEKVPLLVLSAASSVVTVLAQRAGGSLGSFVAIPLGPRLANAVVSYVVYLAQTVWPARLAVFYPHPASHATSTRVFPAVAAATFVVVVSLLVARFARRKPHLAVGWCWYLGMLVPMIGIVQVGMQARADRYTYLPTIGLYVLLAFGLRDLLPQRVRAGRRIAAVLAVLLLAIATHAQVRTWRSDTTLYEHALRVTTDNYFAHNNLGVERMRQGQMRSAESEIEAALRIKPDYPDALFNLGSIRMKEGRFGEASSLFERALRLAPDHARAESGLGAARLRLGDRTGAARSFERALSLDRRLVEAQNGLGVLKMEGGDLEGAVRCFRAALEPRPDYPEAHSNLGRILRAQGRFAEAAEEQERALRARPDYPQAEHELGLALLAQGDVHRARTHLRRAVELAPQDERARRDLEALELRESGAR